MTDIVRRVIIQTQIEAENMGSRPMGGPGSAGGGSRSVGGARSPQQIGSKEEWLSRVKVNSLEMERKQLAELQRQKDRAHRENLRNIKAEVQYRLDMRRMEERSQKFKSGAGVNRGGQGANYFSTGFAPLDAANQIGFQGFITAMTIRMAAQIGTGIMDNLQGWMTGKGESALAGGHRFLSTGRADKGGAIESLGIMGDRWASLWGGKAIFDPDLKGDAFMRGRGMSQQRIEIQKIHAREFIDFGTAQGELQTMVDLWDAVHGKARQAAEQELENAQKRLDRAKVEFGMMNAFDRVQVVDAARRYKAGMPVAREEMQMLRPLIEDTKEEQKRRDAIWGSPEAKALRGLFPSLEGDVAAGKEKVKSLEPVVTINGVTFNISAKMDEITEEMSRRLGEMMREQLRLSPMFQEYEKAKKAKGAPGGNLN